MRAAVFLKLGGWSDTCLINFMGSAFKEKFPKASTTLITGKSLGDWTSCLNFDRVILVDDQKFFPGGHSSFESLKLVFKLRAHSFDVGFNLHRFLKFDQVLKWGGAKKIISLKDVENKRSDIEQYLELLSKIEVLPLKLNFRINMKQHVHEDIMKRLANLEMRSKNYLVVSPGDGENRRRPFKHLKWDHYGELISLFCKRTPYPLIILGGQADAELALRLTALVPSRVKSLVGVLNREEMAAVISESLAFVGNDSGPAHVAGSIGVPSVVLFGPTSSVKHQPPGKGKSVTCIDGFVPCSPCAKNDGPNLDTDFDWTCGDNACMKSISPEQAWAALSKISNLQT